MSNTNTQYDTVIKGCRDIYTKKTKDYGTSWRVLRTISIVDQIFIKAKRIRTIQENRLQKIGDDIASEFRGMVNYAVIGIIQLSFTAEDAQELPPEQALALYDQEIKKAKALMQDKNHDYGEAWRDMSQESFTDLILSKLLRIKQIIGNNGKTIASEGIDANYYDIINYAIFALILMEEESQQSEHSTFNIQK